MANPVYLDGPLRGQDHPVPDTLVEQGMYHYAPDTIYTFTRVMVFDRVVLVASDANILPDSALLFAALISPAGQRAAE